MKIPVLQGSPNAGGLTAVFVLAFARFRSVAMLSAPRVGALRPETRISPDSTHFAVPDA